MHTGVQGRHGGTLETHGDTERGGEPNFAIPWCAGGQPAPSYSTTHPGTQVPVQKHISQVHTHQLKALTQTSHREGTKERGGWNPG